MYKWTQEIMIRQKSLAGGTIIRFGMIVAAVVFTANSAKTDAEVENAVIKVRTLCED